jgi:hypothetical protein
MEDSLSVKSNESVATSEEFDFVGDKPGANKTPTLDIKNGDMNELKSALTEVLQETGRNMDVIEGSGKKIGHSTFYSCLVEPGKDPLSVDLETSPEEKRDAGKDDSNDDEEGKVVSARFCLFTKVS